MAAIEWSATGAVAPDSECGGDAPGRSIAWSKDGVKIALPVIVERLCLFGSEASAVNGFASRSLSAIAVDDFPNLDDASEFTPDAWNASSLRADDAGLGCGLGDPNGYCASWFFHGRYGDAVLELTYVADGKGLPYDRFLSLLQKAEEPIVDAARA
jgi:hypothetical protein